MVVPAEMKTNGIIVPAEMETEPIQDIPPSEENVSTSAFYPQVRNELKPFKGQQFKTWEEAHVFYTKYAFAAGFIVRIGSIREDCKARMIVVRDKSGGFVVNIFDEAHTHPMTSPKRLHLLKSNRRLTKAQRSLWEQLSMVNIPTHQQFDILGVQAGGFQYIGCTQQDLYNLERDKRKETKGHDGEMLHDYFLLEQEKNSGFFFTIKADVENRITHCFWADAISRQSYKFYGGPPKMIITDQDPAMEKAIFEVLLDTFHRYCSWHILRKFSEKLDAIKFRDHYDEFKNCIYSSENAEEFDFKWKSVLAKSGLSGHKWLQSIYEIRFRWVSAYMNHIFSAGMSSSQRAESTHSFFKDYVSHKNSLVDFMVQFSRGLLHKRHEELISDHIDINEKPRFKCPSKMEKQMVVIYTRKYYYIFQDQLWESYSYNLEVTKEDETNCILKVMRQDREDGRARVIRYDKSKDFASCSCKLFESAGVPCRHVLAHLHKLHQVHKLPYQYILKRWTKSARSEVVMDKIDMEITVRKSLLEKHGLLFQQYSHVIDSVVLSE
ncbi:protein FAR1-RELATED SEQUENCE 5-like [Rosa rugosa]|uniref:protein FAR1-RELATED SEQUENCE 5-like n=1 Tax=Rosa rugosa TaxID=74645 RepID=UPI002B41832E|nr:protein FAR1-RELATED SEQUENCE 5-like [Rosa rugosa]